MPTYQYACTNADCGNRFELVQSFTDPAASECPVCVGPVRKVYGSVGVVFKGSGFYRTDSRAGSVAAKADAAKSDSGKSDSGKSDGPKADAGKSDSGKSDKPSSGSSSGSTGSGSGSKVAASA